MARRGPRSRCGATSSSSCTARRTSSARRTTPRAALVTSANLTRGRPHTATSSSASPTTTRGRAAAGAPLVRRALGACRDRSSDELRDLLFPRPGLVDPQTMYLRALLELYGDEVRRPYRATRDHARAARAVPARRLRARAAHPRAPRRRRLRRRRRHRQDGDRPRLHRGVRARAGGVSRSSSAPAQLRENWEERIAQASCPPRSSQLQRARAATSSSRPRRPTRRRAPAQRQGRLPAGRRRRGARAAQRGHDVVPRDGAAARRRAQGRRAAHRDADQQRALGPLQPRDAVRPPRPRVRGDRHRLQCATCSWPPARTSATPRTSTPTCSSRSPTRSASAATARSSRATTPDEQFPDGTPVRFPSRGSETRRYDLDAAHPGLLDADRGRRSTRSTMARYRPSALSSPAEEASAEAQLGGLLQSQLLKRFESCWRACLATVERDARSPRRVPDGVGARRACSRAKQLVEAAPRRGGRGRHRGLGRASAREGDARPPGQRLRARVRRGRRAPTATSWTRSATRSPRSTPATDPKLRLLRELLEASPAEKVAVFATYGETIALPRRAPARRWSAAASA